MALSTIAERSISNFISLFKSFRGPDEENWVRVLQSYQEINRGLGYSDQRYLSDIQRLCKLRVYNLVRA